MNQHSGKPREPKTKRGRETRDKLLQAAEIEFGERGYHDGAISEITRRAGVALGTFYVYFGSKEEIFRALVAHMNRLTRRWISERVSESPDRLTAERRGLEAFIIFVRQHRNLYRIIAEAQFVAEDAFRDHYAVFADAYQEHLELAGANAEIRPGDYEVWAWALIGMNVFLGMRFAVWDDTRTPAEMAATVSELIGNGMLPRDPKNEP